MKGCVAQRSTENSSKAFSASKEKNAKSPVFPKSKEPMLPVLRRPRNNLEQLLCLPRRPVGHHVSLSGILAPAWRLRAALWSAALGRGVHPLLRNVSGARVLALGLRAVAVQPAPRTPAFLAAGVSSTRLLHPQAHAQHAESRRRFSGHSWLLRVSTDSFADC